FVFNNTDFILDINGYYAPQSGITLAQGSAGAPSLSFAGDPGTGIYSPGPGSLAVTGSVGVSGSLSASAANITGQLYAAGALAVDGNSTFAGQLYAAGNVGIGTTNPNFLYKLDVENVQAQSGGVYARGQNTGVLGNGDSYGVIGRSSGSGT